MTSIALETEVVSTRFDKKRESIDEEFHWTYVNHRDEGEWLCGFIRHKADLSDLAPPYRKVVEETIALKNDMRKSAG